MTQSQSESADSQEVETRKKILLELRDGILERSQIMERLNLSYESVVRHLKFLSSPDMGLVDIETQSLGNAIFYYVEITSLGLEFIEDPDGFAQRHPKIFTQINHITNIENQNIGDHYTIGNIQNASGVAIGRNAQASVSQGAQVTDVQDHTIQPPPIPEDGSTHQGDKIQPPPSQWISELTKLTDQWIKEAQVIRQNNSDEHSADHWEGMARGYEHAAQTLRQLLDQQDQTN